MAADGAPRCSGDGVTLTVADWPAYAPAWAVPGPSGGAPKSTTSNPTHCGTELQIFNRVSLSYGEGLELYRPQTVIAACGTLEMFDEEASLCAVPAKRQ